MVQWKGLGGDGSITQPKETPNTIGKRFPVQQYKRQTTYGFFYLYFNRYELLLFISFDYKF